MKSQPTIQKLLVTIILIVALTLMFFLAFQKESTPIQPRKQTRETSVPHFIVNIPQKALLKNYVTVSAEAPAGTACELTFIPASGETQVMVTTANADGLCEWRWKLEESYGKGNARLIFTINGVSDTHFLEILLGF